MDTFDFKLQTLNLLPRILNLETRNLNFQIRTLHSDSESRTKEGLVKMAAVNISLNPKS